MDLNQIGTFVRVVESGTFTAAAAALGLPKSSVSRGVAALEEALGVRLLQRTTRKLSLTEAGRQYFQQARASLSGLEQASSAVADLGSEPRGIVRLTAPGDFGDRFSEIFADFVRRYPRIQLDLVFTQRRVNLIEEGFDLALRAGKLEDSSLVARKIAGSELGLYAAPSYLARRGLPKRLGDLTKHDCLLHRTARGVFPWRLSGPRGYELVSVSGIVTADSLEFIRGLVVAGAGIALLPDLGLEDDLARGALVRVLPAYALGGGALYLVSPPLQHEPARVALLRAHLVAELPNRIALPRRAPGRPRASVAP